MEQPQKRAQHQTKQSPPVIAIIGGGVSGALTAVHMRREQPTARIIVIEPKPEIGLGLAYSTPSCKHLLNVPAGKISAFPDHPDHFLNWLRHHHDVDATAETFAPRAVFGRYVHSIFTGAAGIEQIRACVIDCRINRSGAALTLDDRQTIEADVVVLAIGNFEPAPLPGPTHEAAQCQAYRHNAWVPETYTGLSVDAPVTLIGTGLTAVDVLLRLRELGHQGTVTAISRHGALPTRHAKVRPLTRPVIPVGTRPACTSYFRAFRMALANGIEWRAAIDSLRPVSNGLWLALSRKEQQRFRRHLQRRWDVVRHRMAPAIANMLENELAAGTLVFRKGRLHQISTTAAGQADVTIRDSTGSLHQIASERVINCTGPNLNYRAIDSPLLQSLFRQGLATPGPLGYGFNTTFQGALIGADGIPSDILFNLGPGRLGTLIESIAVPEIREQAVSLSRLLTNDLDTGIAAA